MYPPQDAADLLSVPIQISTSRGVESKKLRHAMTLVAHRAEAVGLIHHQHGLVPLLDLDEFGDIRIVTVHAVDPLDRNQHTPVLRTYLRAACDREPHNRCGGTVDGGHPTTAHPGRCCCEPSASWTNQIARADQVTDRRLVGGMPADHQDRSIDTNELSDLPLQLSVDRLLTRDQPTRRNTRPVTASPRRQPP